MSWYTPIAQGGGMGDYAPANPFIGEFNFGGQNWFLQDANPMQNSGLNTTSPVYKAFMPGSAGLTEGFFTLGPDGKPQLMHSDYNPNESWGDDFKAMAPVLGAAALGYGAEYLGLLGGATPNPSFGWAYGGSIPGFEAAMPALGAAGGAAPGAWGGSEELFLQNPALGPGAQAGVGAGAGAVGGIPATGAGAGFEGLMPGAWNPGNFTGVPPSSGLPSTSPAAPPGAPSGGGTPPAAQVPGAGSGLLDWMKSNPGLALLGAGLLGGLVDGSKVEDLYGGRKTAIDRLNANRAPASPWGRY